MAITGLKAAGKTTVAYAFRKAKYPVISTGDVIRDEARSRGLEPSAEHLNTISREFLEFRQEEILLRLRDRLIASLQTDRVAVVEGIKTPLERAQLRLIAQTNTVAVLASRGTRLERLARRGRLDDSATLSALVNRDAWELANGLGSLIATADYFIVNETSLNQLATVAAGVARKIREEVSRHGRD